MNIDIGSLEAVEFLTRYVKTSNDIFQVLTLMMGMKSLARLGSTSQSALPDIREVYENHLESTVREVAGVALWCIEPKSAPKTLFKMLEKSLNDSYYVSRQNTAGFLEMIGVPAKKLIKPLLRLLEDKEASVRMTVARAVCIIDPSKSHQAMSVLADGLRNTDMLVHMNATTSLIDLIDKLRV